MKSFVDSLKEIIDALSEALNTKETQKIQILLMNFFSSLPFIIKIGSLDSCNQIFKLLNQISPVSERDRITKSIQERFSSGIYEHYQTEQDLSEDVSLEYRSMINDNKIFFPIEREDRGSIQAFLESHLDKLIDIYFSFSPSIQKQTFQDFFKFIKSYPQKFSEIFPKIMEYQRENRISEEEFIQISLFAVDTNPKRIISAICEELFRLNSKCSFEDLEAKSSIIKMLILFLKETYTIYPEEYWDFISGFIELINPHFSSFSMVIFEVLIFFAKKGSGELLAYLNSLLNAFDIEGIDRDSLVRLLRELNDLLGMPEFKIPDLDQEEIKRNLFSRILFNFDETSQICFDLLLSLIDSTQTEDTFLLF